MALVYPLPHGVRSSVPSLGASRGRLDRARARARDNVLVVPYADPYADPLPRSPSADRGTPRPVKTVRLPYACAVLFSDLFALASARQRAGNR
jgi:hypothetical protein